MCDQLSMLAEYSFMRRSLCPLWQSFKMIYYYLYNIIPFACGKMWKYRLWRFSLMKLKHYFQFLDSQTIPPILWTKCYKYVSIRIVWRIWRTEFFDNEDLNDLLIHINLLINLGHIMLTNFIVWMDDLYINKYLNVFKE